MREKKKKIHLVNNSIHRTRLELMNSWCNRFQDIDLARQELSSSLVCIVLKVENMVHSSIIDPTLTYLQTINPNPPNCTQQGQNGNVKLYSTTCCHSAVWFMYKYKLYCHAKPLQHPLISLWHGVIKFWLGIMLQFHYSEISASQGRMEVGGFCKCISWWPKNSHSMCLKLGSYVSAVPRTVCFPFHPFDFWSINAG